MKYYARLNIDNTILGISNFISPNSIEIDKEIFENYQDYIFDGNNFTINPYLEDIKELQRIEEIGKLYMTRLDFIKALESIGISWMAVKGLMEQYPEVEKELMLCSNVYRGNPLIDQFAKNFNVTSEQLDNLFIQKCEREDLLEH